MVTETFESDGRRHPSLAAFAAERKVLRFHTKRAAIKYFKEQGFKRVLGNNNAWRSDELSAIWVSAPADEPAGFVVMRRVEK